MLVDGLKAMGRELNLRPSLMSTADAAPQVPQIVNAVACYENLMHNGRAWTKTDQATGKPCGKPSSRITCDPTSYMRSN